MSITLTPAAVEHIKKFISKRDDIIGLRIAVRTTGCSGLAYVLEMATVQNGDDTRFDQDEIALIVDAKSLVYIDGTELDYTHEGLNEGFKFMNPNTKSECGCGESFTVG